MLRFIALLVVTFPALASTIGTAQISGFGTYTISGDASAYYANCPCNTDPASVASASASAFTLGPVRAGFLEITGIGDAEMGVASATIGSYSSGCHEFGCFPSLVATVPFTLGVPFQIDVDATATQRGAFMTGAATIDFHFSLAESFQGTPGAFVVIYQGTPATVPEPATFGAVGLGLLGLAKINAARRQGSHSTACRVVGL
jgi:hypothetical protein